MNDDIMKSHKKNFQQKGHYMVLSAEDLQLIRGEIILIVEEKIHESEKNLTKDIYRELREISDKMVTIDVFNQRAKQVDKRFEDLIHQMDKRFEQVDKRFEQVDKRFEQVDKRFEDLIANMNSRFEQVDKRFEQVDKRFEDLIANMNSRFTWISSIGLASVCGIFTAIGGLYLKLFLG